MDTHPPRDEAPLLQRGPSAEILRLLQRNGPMSTKQLRAALGVSSLNAVREQLMSLAAAGLVQMSPVRQGTGRPTHMYALSDKAYTLFPQGYDVLLKLLLEELAAREGAERLQTLLQGVSVRLAEQYGGQSDGQALRERLTVLAEASAARGTPITVMERDDAVLLHEWCCPYFNVAQATGDVCAVEQQMLEQVLGQKVRLTQRVVDGHIGCQFVIDGSSVHEASSARFQAAGDDVPETCACRAEA